MKLSVMLFPFHNALNDGSLRPASLLTALADEGVSGIEPASAWVRAQPEGWARFHDKIKEVGMAYSCYDVGVNLIGESEADRTQVLETVREEITYCRTVLACPTMLLPGTKPAAGMSNEEGRRLYGDMLAKVAAENSNSRITVTIEDFGVYPDFAASIDHCRRVLDQAGDTVKFTFDNGNFLLADDRPLDAYQALRERIAHIHIKDFCRRTPDGTSSLTSVSGVPYKGCLVGEGDGQVAECLAQIKQDGYDGWISIEVGGENPLDQALHAARFIRRTWERAR